MCKLDKHRAANALLYVTNKIKNCDFHKAFKILYFADMYHLESYGRTITGDWYVAMSFGPVPSSTYDMLKNVRGDGWYEDNDYKALFRVENQCHIIPLRQADMDYLSVSDVQMLDKAIANISNTTFNERSEKSHGLAWQRGKKNGELRIAYEDMLEEQGADKEYIDYVMSVL